MALRTALLLGPRGGMGEEFSNCYQHGKSLSSCDVSNSGGITCAQSVDVTSWAIKPCAVGIPDFFAQRRRLAVFS